MTLEILTGVACITWSLLLWRHHMRLASLEAVARGQLNAIEAMMKILTHECGPECEPPAAPRPTSATPRGEQ